MIDILVLPDGLDKGSVGRIVGSLLPNEKVDEDTAVKIIACLGLGAERAPLQNQVCLWVSSLTLGVSTKMAGYGVSILDLATTTPTVVRGNL